VIDREVVGSSLAWLIDDNETSGPQTTQTDAVGVVPRLNDTEDVYATIASDFEDVI